LVRRSSKYERHLPSPSQLHGFFAVLLHWIDIGGGVVGSCYSPTATGVWQNSVSAQFWIWAGANIAPINWVLGALGINLGLGLRDTFIV
jgi:hypothetical protein